MTTTPDAPATAPATRHAPVLALLAVAGLTAFFVSDGGLPEAAPADSPAAEFSALRALGTLQRVAAAPRPMGSPAHATVRDLLVAELRALGLEPQVQTATHVVRSTFGAPYAGGIVHNVLARLPGSDGAPAVLLMAHYDTLPGTPGAADDAAGVAVLIESARALKSGTPPRRDVILLFSDGEESGSLGAEAFVTGHPWADDVAVAVNLEARGNTGPALLFEVIGNDGWALEQYGQAVTSPAATSLSEEIYSRMPNDTDLSAFKSRSVTGLNFAFAEGVTAYHAATDTVERLDLRSVQHMGTQVLALTRRFGELDLGPARTPAPGPVFFSAPLVRWVAYPRWLVYALLFLSVAAGVALAGAGFRARRLSFGGLALGVTAVPILALAGALAAALLVVLVFKLHPNYTWMPRANLYNASVYQVGMLLFVLALVALFFGWLSRRTRPENLLAGGLLWWLALALLTSFLAPGASYLFVWPLLMALTALAARGLRPAAAPWLGSVFAVPTILLLGSTLHLLFVAFGIAFSAPAVVLFVLGLVLYPAHAASWSGSGPRVAGIAVAGVVVCLVVGAFGATFDGRRPRPNSLVYALDADRNDAAWFSFDSGPDPFTAQFVAGAQVEARPEEFLPFGPRRHWRGKATAVPLHAPTATLLSEERTGANRVLRLRLASNRDARRLSVYLPADVTVVAGALDGHPLPAAEPGSEGAGRRQATRWGIDVGAVPAAGVELTIEVAGTQPVALRVVDWSVGVPSAALEGARLRPPDSVPAPTRYGETTLVGRTFEL